MNEWELIESAPTDGRKILGWGKVYPEHVVISWQAGPFMRAGWCTHPAYDDGDLVTGYVTHWMPLPESPK